MAHSIACKTFCKSFTIISAEVKYLNITRYFVINAKDHEQCFIANRSLNAIKEYKYINRVDKKVGIELYFDATFNELYCIELCTTKWLVIYEHFAHKDELLVASFPALAKAREYVRQKEEVGLKRYKIVYGDVIYH